MHPRAAELIAQTLARVQARGFNGLQPIPMAPVESIAPVRQGSLDHDEFAEIDGTTPLPGAPPLTHLAERVLSMALRGCTPHMVAHELRLHPKRVRQIARDHFITFNRQRSEES